MPQNQDLDLKYYCFYVEYDFFRNKTAKQKKSAQ